jgi:hypothetical protein
MARPGEGDRVGDQPACRGLAPVHPAEVCVTFDQTSLAIDPRPGRGPCENEAARQNLERRIASHLSSGRLALGITDNNFTMISVRRDRGPVYRVRLHHMFVTAPPTVTRALARYIAENEFQASRFLTRYIEENQHAIRRAARRRAPALTLETLGEVYDLQEVFDELNTIYFEDKIDARITWGAPGAPGRPATAKKLATSTLKDRRSPNNPPNKRR